jgi:hypothetical protein
VLSLATTTCLFECVFAVCAAAPAFANCNAAAPGDLCGRCTPGATSKGIKLKRTMSWSTGAASVLLTSFVYSLNSSSQRVQLNVLWCKFSTSAGVLLGSSSQVIRNMPHVCDMPQLQILECSDC